jgi:hypothetical protein
MPLHRRRVYFDYAPSRRARIESGLSFSIYLSGGILILSLLGCLPDVVSLILRWLLPDALVSRLGVISGAEQVSLLTTLCEVLMTASGVYLVLALFIRSHSR